MGNQTSKKKENSNNSLETKTSKEVSSNIKPNQSSQPIELTQTDIDFLTYATSFSKSEIQNIFDSFIKNNPDAQLNQNEFIRIYNELRPEPIELLDDISVFVFRAFDKDLNGTINFNEFLIAYAMTSRGDLRKRLEYAFVCYDTDNSGYLDYNELKSVLSGMLDLLGAENKDATQIAEQCLRELDSTGDGRISKGKGSWHF